MPKRPRSHVIEDLARASIKNIFSLAGWTVEDLRQDYGEDIIVRVFDNGTATPLHFFVQSKSTDNISRFKIDDGRHYAVPIRTAHLSHWKLFSEPVVITLFDSASETTYWTIAQEQDVPRKGASTSIRISADDVLDDEGIRRLRRRTKARFERLEAVREGAALVVDAIREEWGVEITYDPEGGVLHFPLGKFVPDPAGGSMFFTFGSLAALLSKYAKAVGVPPDKFMKDSFKYLYNDQQKRLTDGASLESERLRAHRLLREANRREELSDD